ncbi:MAG: hypothetical protein HYY24_21250 [Verrucomicrobia bacterium]|nr:hypothetical protein [Verrucomicrobiota bacterium]
MGTASEAAGKSGPSAVSSATEGSGGEQGRHRRRRQRSWKSKLSNKLIYSPFLRMVVLKPGFRLAVIAFGLLLSFLALFLPTIWTASPNGFLPIVKVSGLDLAQAWLAKRNARQAVAAGQFGDAVYSWQVALAHNAVDTEALRGALRTQLAADRAAPPNLEDTARQTLWLLRLGGTNQADVELVGSVYYQYRLDDRLLGLLRGLAEQRGPQSEAAYLKALFHTGRLEDFAHEWRRVGANLASDAELPLYHAAYLAGWGPREQAAEASRRVAEAMADTKLRLTGARLQLAVSRQLNDAAGYAAALQRLEEARADTLLDEVGYWRVLAAAGRATEAQQLALDDSRPPANPFEVVALAQAHAALDQVPRARALLDRFAQQFVTASEIWIAHTDLLIDRQQWEEARAVALKMRQQNGVRDAVMGFSYCVEGRAEFAQRRPDLAEASFAKAAQFAFEPPRLGVAAARTMTGLGFPSPATVILATLEPALETDADYWQALSHAAFELKDPALLMRATERAARLNAQDPAAQQRYATALVASRQRPEEALRLTSGLIADPAASAGVRVTHGLALLLNNRTSEAESVLAAVRPEELAGAEASAYHLAWFEAHATRQRSEQAWQAVDRIEPRHLFPAQLEWLKQQQQQLPARAGAKS